MNLTTQYLGMALASPLVASSSPLTRQLDGLLRLEDAGVGAVVLPSLFEEEVEAEALVFAERLDAGSGVQGEAGSYFPDLDLDHLGLERHLLLVEEASARLSIPVIASLNGTSPGGWVRYARELVDAGARALELNIYEVAADPQQSGGEVEARERELVRSVCASVDVPVAVKMSPFHASIAHAALGLVDAGAQGLIVFNRFYQPDLDIDTLDVAPRLDLSRSADLRLPLRWAGILRPLLPATSLAITTGVAEPEDLVKAILVGADTAMSASELLRGGPQRAAQLLDGLRAWMQEHDYESVSQMRGSVAHHSAADPSAYERAQYQRVLSSWRLP